METDDFIFRDLELSSRKNTGIGFQRAPFPIFTSVKVKCKHCDNEWMASKLDNTTCNTTVNGVIFTCKKCAASAHLTLNSLFRTGGG